MKATNDGSGVIATITDTIVNKKRFPVYVAEGTSQQKMRKINSVAYLRHCYETLRQNPASVRAFLDSRYGRHFANGVNGQMHYGASLADAIAKTTAEWMGWRITQRTSRETGIPAGLPYLTGFVINEGIAAEAQD